MAKPRARADRARCHPGDPWSSHTRASGGGKKHHASVDSFPLPGALRGNWWSISDANDWGRRGATPTLEISLTVQRFDYLEGKKTSAFSPPHESYPGN